MSSPARKQCAALVYKRDTYRVDGRAKSGFSMHYRQCQCTRAAVEVGLCRQHRKMELEGQSISVPRWVTRDV